MLRPLAISAGDPAGVGPAVTAAALSQCLRSDRALVYGDASWMESALRRYGFESFERVVSGEFDHLPEQAFYMRGGIDEVIEAARELEAQA